MALGRVNGPRVPSQTKNIIETGNVFSQPLSAQAGNTALCLSYGTGSGISLSNITQTLLGTGGLGGIYAGSNINVSGLTPGNGVGDNIVFSSGAYRTGSGPSAGGSPHQLTITGSAVNNILMFTSWSSGANITYNGLAGAIYLGCLSATTTLGGTSVGIGYAAISSSANSVAVGQSANASQTAATAIGSGAVANSTSGAVAIGSNASAGVGILAVGSSCSANGGANAVAIGSNCQANKANSTVLGYYGIPDFIGETVFSNGYRNANGDSKTSLITQWLQTTNATPTELGVPSTGTGAPNTYIQLLTPTTIAGYFFDVRIVGINTGLYLYLSIITNVFHMTDTL